jgi:hypothetical protein
MEFTLIEVMKMAAIGLPAVAAFGGAKVALNGTRSRVKKLETRTEDLDSRTHKMNESLTRIETKTDILLKHYQKG